MLLKRRCLIPSNVDQLPLNTFEQLLSKLKAVATKLILIF